MTIRATDNEAYATELWGDNKAWDDERKQYVPTDEDNKGAAATVQESDAEEVQSPDSAETGAIPNSVQTADSNKTADTAKQGSTAKRRSSAPGDAS